MSGRASLALGLLLCGRPAPAVSAQQPPVFETGVELVRVEVSVTRDGDAVTGLGAENFEVRDNGIRQILNPVLLERVPLDVTLALDVSMSVRGPRLLRLREAAQAFLEGLAPEDRAGLVAFSHQARRVQALTDDETLVRDAISQVQPQGSTSLRDTAFALVGSREPDERRAAVVVLTDAADNTSWLRAEDVLEAARRSDLVVYVVLAIGNPRVVAAPVPDKRSLAFVRDLARTTGGQVWEVRRLEDLKRSFVDVLRHIHSRYLLTYSPAGVDRDGWHSLDVRLVGARGDVLARPGYYRPPPRR